MKRRTQGEYRRPLSRTVKEGSSQHPLYLVHVTAVGSGREIVAQNVLEARYCKFFKQKLLYFFINRPGYRAKESNEKSDQINRFPLDRKSVV